MRTNDSGLLVLLFLILALALVVPLLFLYSYHGSAALPALTYRNIAIAATAGLFIIPALFIYIAAAIILAAKTRRAGPARTHYPWDNAFPEVVNEAKLPLPRARAAGAAAKKAATKATPQESAVNVRAVLAVALVILLLVGLAFWSQRMSGIFGYQSNLTKANVSMAKNVSHTLSEAGKITNATMPASITKLSAENKSAVKSIAITKNATPAAGKAFSINNFKNFVTAAKNSGVKTAGKIIGWFRGLAGKVGNYIQKMPIVVWRSVTAAVLVIILIAALFYSHKTGQLREIGEWLKDIAGWLGTIPAVIRDNFAKIIMPAILIIVAVALVAGYVFRKWLGANLPGFAFMASNLVNLPSVARDFILVYRLYILIGVFTLLAVIGFLMTVERRGNGKKQSEADGEKQPKNSAPVVSKKKNGRKRI